MKIRKFSINPEFKKYESLSNISRIMVLTKSTNFGACISMNKLFSRLLIRLLFCCTFFAGFCFSESFAQAGGVEFQKLNLEPGINNIRFRHGDLIRELIIHLPSGYKKDTEYPVLMFFHGYGGTKEFELNEMESFLKNENLIAVLPQGIERSWNTGMNEVPSKADDVGFILRFLDCLAMNTAINKNRIYSAGYSNGGAFSYKLALETDRLAAIAVISASFFTNQRIGPEIPKISIMQIHGELDRKVPYSGGQSSALKVSFESAYNTVRMWAVHNGLNTDPDIAEPEANLIVYRFCKEDSPYETVLYRMKDTTHHIITHPLISSGKWYHEIWEFFKKFKKSEDN